MTGSRFIGNLAHVAMINVLDGPVFGTGTIPDIAFCFFQLMFAATATTSRSLSIAKSDCSFLSLLNFSCYRCRFGTRTNMANYSIRFHLVYISLQFHCTLDLVSNWVGSRSRRIRLCWWCSSSYGSGNLRICLLLYAWQTSAGDTSRTKSFS